MKAIWACVNGAFLFYTCLPLPRDWPVSFSAVAKFAPLLGVWIGSLLGIEYWILHSLHTSTWVCSALVLLTGLWITGGLHFDGAMDTADGLAVQDPQQRLRVMADSRTGAFGVMVAIAIILLKLTALASLGNQSPVHIYFALMITAGWSRWGQQWAIASYPYLKANGKGAFHKQAIQSKWDTLPSALMLIGLSIGFWQLQLIPWVTALTAPLIGITASIALATWLNQKLGGHTGDTYGAIVEWVEAITLVALSAHLPSP